MSDDIDYETLSRLKEIMGERFPLLVDTYLTNAKQYIEDIKGGVANEDMDAVINAAHTMISASGNLGLSKLSETARAIETGAMEVRDNAGSIDGVKELISGIDDMYDTAQEVLQAA